MFFIKTKYQKENHHDVVISFFVFLSSRSPRSSLTSSRAPSRRVRRPALAALRAHTGRLLPPSPPLMRSVSGRSLRAPPRGRRQSTSTLRRSGTPSLCAQRGRLASVSPLTSSGGETTSSTTTVAPTTTTTNAPTTTIAPTTTTVAAEGIGQPPDGESCG